MILSNNIPDDWNIHSIEELFDFISTKSLSRAQLTSENGEYQYLHYGDIHSTFKFPMVDTEKDKLPSILNDVELKGSITFLKEGDLVIADASEDLEGVGMCIELKNIKDKKVIGGLHTIVCRDKIGKTVNGIRPYLIKNPQVLKSIKRIATGASVLGISKGNLKGINIALPPLPEQQKIAEILSTVDAKIEVIDQQITETAALKKGLMQRLLTKGIGHTEFKDSPLGEIPQSWEVVSVKDITKEHKQGFYTKDGYVEDGIRLARITDLNNPKVDYSEMPMLNISDSDYQSYKIEKGDFLFARSGAIGTYGIVENEEYPAVFASYLIRFRFNTNITNRFFGYFFESNLCKNQLRGITQGNANVNINAENIKSLKFPFAPFPEQEKIASIISSVDDKIEVLRDKTTLQQELKKGLMQQLLTGKIRVNALLNKPVTA